MRDDILEMILNWQGTYLGRVTLVRRGDCNSNALSREYFWSHVIIAMWHSEPNT